MKSPPRTELHIRALASLMRKVGVQRRPDEPATHVSTEATKLLIEHRLHALATAQSDQLAPLFDANDESSELISMLTAARQSLRVLAMRDAILEKGLADALHALELAGVQPLILKGRALALTLYDQPWHRPHSDVDLLIDAGDVVVVRRVLSEAGFSLPHGIRGQFTSHQFLYSRSLAAGVELHLDIHWKLSNRHQFAHAIIYRDARRRARALLLHDVPHRIVSFEDALLHALIHLYAHHHDEFQPAIWLFDIYLLIERLDDSQILAVLRRAQSVGASSVVTHGIERTVEACGTILSTTVRAALRDLPEDESKAFFEMSRLGEIRSDLFVISNNADRLRYLAEVAFPPGNSMLERYGYESRLMLPLAYARRVLEFRPRLSASSRETEREMRRSDE